MTDRYNDATRDEGVSKIVKKVLTYFMDGPHMVHDCDEP